MTPAGASCLTITSTGPPAMATSASSRLICSSDHQLRPGVRHCRSTLTEPPNASECQPGVALSVAVRPRPPEPTRKMRDVVTDRPCPIAGQRQCREPGMVLVVAVDPEQLHFPLGQKALQAEQILTGSGVGTPVTEVSQLQNSPRAASCAMARTCCAQPRLPCQSPARATPSRAVVKLAATHQVSQDQRAD
jgi:hypothetical protein